MALTLCHITDKMFASYLKHLEQRFLEEGGIKERMHSARTGYKQDLQQRLLELEAENCKLKEENEALKRQIAELRK